MTRAYYNEFDAKAAACLREFIRAGLIAPGDVDERSISDVRASDLAGYGQCHFFAGFGFWSYALRLAGWPDDRPVWTGSCPCQPFSCAGKQRGTADERHLWPAFRDLIQACQPQTVFGEQVASAAVVGKAGKRAASPDANAWLDEVFDDLNAAQYATSAAILTASFVGAPHIRARLYWVAQLDKCGVLCSTMQEHITERIARAYETMLEVQEGKTAVGVRAGEKVCRQLSLFMSDMRQEEKQEVSRRQSRTEESGSCEKASTAPRDGKGIPTTLSPEVCLENAGDARQEKGGAVRVGLRFGRPSSGDPEAGAGDEVRDDRSVLGQRIGLRRAGAAVLQHNLAGQDRPEQGLPVLEHSDCVLGDELRDGDVGRIRVEGAGSGVDEKEVLNAGTGVSTRVQDAHHAEWAGHTQDHSVGAPHIRQRLYWVAHDTRTRGCRGLSARGGQEESRGRGTAGRRTDSTLGGLGADGRAPGDAGHAAQRGGGVRGLADRLDARLEGHAGNGDNRHEPRRDGTLALGHAAEGGDSRWQRAAWWPCLDGKLRRVPATAEGTPEPGLFPLADAGEHSGYRVPALRGAGNAIVPAVAADFIRAAGEVIDGNEA